jgi:hypothetical protein
LLQEKLRAERLTASKALCAQIAPEFQRRAKATAAAAAALSEALASYTEMTAGLRREGIAWAELGALDGVDDLAREHGPVARLIKSAVEAGHIAARAARKV